jgi:hypothetical protein
MMAKNSRPISSDAAAIPRCGYWAASAGGSALASANRFVGQPELVTSSKMAIFLASLTAGVAGYLWLQAFGKPLASDDNVETMDFEQQP